MRHNSGWRNAVKKIFVIAGTADQARRWINMDAARRWSLGDTSVTLSDYISVFNPTQIRGHDDPHGVFVGTWKQRDNIVDIIQALLVATRGMNPRLRDVCLELQGVI